MSGLAVYCLWGQVFSYYYESVHLLNYLVYCKPEYTFFDLVLYSTIANRYNEIYFHCI